MVLTRINSAPVAQMITYENSETSNRCASIAGDEIGLNAWECHVRIHPSIDATSSSQSSGFNALHKAAITTDPNNAPISGSITSNKLAKIHSRSTDQTVSQRSCRHLKRWEIIKNRVPRQLRSLKPSRSRKSRDAKTATPVEPINGKGESSYAHTLPLAIGVSSDRTGPDYLRRMQYESGEAALGSRREELALQTKLNRAKEIKAKEGDFENRSHAAVSRERKAWWVLKEHELRMGRSGGVSEVGEGSGASAHRDDVDLTDGEEIHSVKRASQLVTFAESEESFISSSLADSESRIAGMRFQIRARSMAQAERGWFMGTKAHDDITKTLSTQEVHFAEYVQVVLADSTWELRSHNSTLGEWYGHEKDGRIPLEWAEEHSARLRVIMKNESRWMKPRGQRGPRSYYQKAKPARYGGNNVVPLRVMN